MNEKFLISLDLDGTLLTSDSKVTEYTEKILKKTILEGHKVMICSGRAPRAIEKYYNQLDLDTPIVCYNGAMIYDPKDKNFNDSALKFKKSEILRFCSEFKDIVPGIMCENEDTIWANEDDEFLFNFYIKDDMNVVIGNIEEILKKDPIIFIGRYIDTPENRKRIIETIENNSDIKVRFWDTDNYFELYYEGVSKYNALISVANYYGIEEKNIYAFGDADNDIEVMTHCKNGIAMKNASNFLLNIAKYHTEYTNNEDGVAKYIEKFILKGAVKKLTSF